MNLITVPTRSTLVSLYQLFCLQFDHLETPSKAYTSSRFISLYIDGPRVHTEDASLSSSSHPQEYTTPSTAIAQPQVDSLLNRSLATPWRLLIAFGLFLLVGIALAWPSLSYPMVYDDLHLIRRFSPQELAQVWHSPWDVDGIETPGLRPLTPLFDHVRFVLFGENVVTHRL